MFDAGAVGSVGGVFAGSVKVPSGASQSRNTSSFRKTTRTFAATGTQRVRRAVGGEVGHRHRGRCLRPAAARGGLCSTRAPAKGSDVRQTTERFMRTKMLTSASLHASMNKIALIDNSPVVRLVTTSAVMKLRRGLHHRVESDGDDESHGELRSQQSHPSHPSVLGGPAWAAGRGLAAGLGLAAPTAAHALPLDPERDVRAQGDPELPPGAVPAAEADRPQVPGDDVAAPDRRQAAGPDHAQREARADDQRSGTRRPWSATRRSPSTCRSGPRSRSTTAGRVNTAWPCRPGRSTSRTPRRTPASDAPMQKMQASGASLFSPGYQYSRFVNTALGRGPGQPRLRRGRDGPHPRDPDRVPGRTVPARRTGDAAARSAASPASTSRRGSPTRGSSSTS